MKKNIFFVSIVLGFAMCLGSCQSSKTSAYRAAYEKAKEKDVSQPVTNDIVVYNPPQVNDIVVYTPPPQNEKTQTEKITPVLREDASSLKKFSVVIYSFKNQTNANSAKDEMIRHGYQVILAQNENKMYRVIVASYDDKASAIAKKNEIRAKYAPRFDDIWILERL